MRKSTDTTERYLQLLDLIPRWPQTRSTTELVRALRDHGYEVDRRTVQRDLNELSRLYPFTEHTQGRSKHWFWPERASRREIPRMDPPTAITLLLVRDYLQSLLPTAILDRLQGYFRNANEVLRNTRFKHWTKTVQLIPRGPELIAPAVDPQVRQIVYQALLDGVCLSVDYDSRSAQQTQRFMVHPLGLVVRHGILYLVGTVWNYTDPRHLALHRMSSPELHEQPARRLKGFSLEQHVHEQFAFAYPTGDKPLKLCALFEPGTAFHLGEARLSEDQQLETQDDGRIRLTATVPDTLELRWWLSGFGAEVEVLKPVSLRKAFRRDAERMAERYQNS